MNNREMLCRGKWIENEKWVEGYYMYHINRTICPIGDSVKPEDEEHIILFDAFSDWSMPRGISCAHVDPKTVCRYTGLTDKNGRKIFEGDILSAHLDDSYPDDITYVQITWNGFSWCMRESTEDDVIEEADGLIWEVCGNIFDNPELLDSGGKPE